MAPIEFVLELYCFVATDFIVNIKNTFQKYTLNRKNIIRIKIYRYRMVYVKLEKNLNLTLAHFDYSLVSAGCRLIMLI